MLTVISKISVIFAVIAVGFFCNKKNILPNSSEPALVNLLILVTCPCMILSSLGSRELDSETLPKTISVIILSAAYFIFSAAVAFLFKNLMKNTPKKDLGVLMIIMTSVNSGFMGYPVTKAIFGDDVFFLIVIQNIVLNIYIYSLGIMQINYGGDRVKVPRDGLKTTIRSILNPNIIAAVIGLILLFGRIRLPEIGMELIDMLGAVTTPLSMIIVGMRLANSKLTVVLKNRDLVLTAIISMIIMPILVFLGVNWLPVTSDVKLLMIWCTCFPTAVVTVGLTSKCGRNATLAAEGLALTTVMSMVLLPIYATLLSGYYGI